MGLERIETWTLSALTERRYEFQPLTNRIVINKVESQMPSVRTGAPLVFKKVSAYPMYPPLPNFPVPHGITIARSLSQFFTGSDSVSRRFQPISIIATAGEQQNIVTPSTPGHERSLSTSYTVVNYESVFNKFLPILQRINNGRTRLIPVERKIPRPP